MSILFDSAAAILETQEAFALHFGFPMTIPTILLPVFIEVGLVFVLLGLMARSRIAALKQGTRRHDVAVSGDAYPPKARQIAACYSNQFEMPLLFIAAVILAIVIRQAGTLFVLIEWLFVIARIGQAVVHTTTNDLSLRSPLFLASAVATALLWLLLALGVLFGIR